MIEREPVGGCACAGDWLESRTSMRTASRKPQVPRARVRRAKGPFAEDMNWLASTG